jgi:hypothetical protein
VVLFVIRRNRRKVFLVSFYSVLKFIAELFARGSIVIKALCYKPEDYEFETPMR